MKYFNNEGTEIFLESLLGKGGEGSVYSLRQNNLVAKIYHSPLTIEKQRKLQKMVNVKNVNLEKISAWPLQILHDENKNIIGFIMPKVDGYEPIHHLYSPQHRKQNFPNIFWRHLICTAKNVVAAFSVIHQYGFVIGDINQGNIMVKQDTTIKLIDCDSFQIGDFLCEVGVVEFTPPELQGQSFNKLKRTQNHDNFGLAVIIFHLLFMGRHPFFGKPLKGEMPELNEAIKNFQFAFSTSNKIKNISPPNGCPTLDILPNDLINLFERAFSEEGINNHRPTVTDWYSALNKFEKDIIKCTIHDAHFYHRSLFSCPWCDLDRKNIIFFININNRNSFDVSIFWKNILEIKLPKYSLKVRLSNLDLDISDIKRSFDSAKNKNTEDLAKINLEKSGINEEIDRCVNTYNRFIKTEEHDNKLLKIIDELQAISQQPLNITVVKINCFLQKLLNTTFYETNDFISIERYRNELINKEAIFNELKNKLDEHNGFFSNILSMFSSELSNEIENLKRCFHKEEKEIILLKRQIANYATTLINNFEGKFLFKDRNKFSKESLQKEIETLSQKKDSLHKKELEINKSWLKTKTNHYSNCQNEIESLEKNYKKEETKYKNSLNVYKNKYDIVISELKKHIEEYNFIHQNIENEVILLIKNKRETQLNIYLSQYHINDCNVSNIGYNRKQLLTSNHIETAADIEYAKIITLHGFGEKITNIIIEWRQNLEKGFVFKAETEVPKSEKDKISYKYLPRLKQIEDMLFRKKEDLLNLVKEANVEVNNKKEYFEKELIKIKTQIIRRKELLKYIET